MLSLFVAAGPPSFLSHYFELLSHWKAQGFVVVDGLPLATTRDTMCQRERFSLTVTVKFHLRYDREVSQVLNRGQKV